MIPPRFEPKFEKVACWEGFTLRESLSGQLMHSQVGPWTEANRVYVDQSHLEKHLAGVAPFVLYDIGMGTAANAIAMIEKWRALGSLRPLRIVSFEKYPEALETALQFQFEFLGNWKDLLENLLASGSLKLPGLEWNLVGGDFLNLDLVPLPRADLVYFDFYSPATCPELWTKEVFSKFSGAGKLITYASTKSVRVAMLLAGFYVGKGLSTSMKLETTVASSSKIPDLLDLSWLESLGRSPQKFPVDLLKKHPQFCG